jgi:hypothetical protein
LVGGGEVEVPGVIWCLGARDRVVVGQEQCRGMLPSWLTQRPGGEMPFWYDIFCVGPHCGGVGHRNYVVHRPQCC